MFRSSTFKRLTLVVIYVLIFTVNGFQRHLNKRQTLYATPGGVNVTAPSKCRDAKTTVNANWVNVTWSAPFYTNGSLGGYQLDYELKEGKNWAKPKKETLLNSTLSYSIKKNKTNDRWKIELRAFNIIPVNGTRLYGQPVFLNNGVAGIFGFSIVVYILAILGLYFANK